MPIRESGLRRVTVYTDSAHADLTLPAGVPVTTLIAGITDLVPHDGQLLPYLLCEPGGTALDGAKTLAQHDICDGAVLVLTHQEPIEPSLFFDDPAEQVATGVRQSPLRWSRAARRPATALVAAELAGVAGFVAVPGGPGAPNVVLAVAAAGTVALLGVAPSGCPEPTRTVLCWLAGVAVLAAVAGMTVAVTGISLRCVGAVTGTVAIGLLRAAGRMAAAFAGLSRPSAAPRVERAQHLLTGMVTAAAAVVVLSAAGVVIEAPPDGVPPVVGALFAAASGAVLALRARSHTDGVQIAALIAGGAAATGIAVVAAALDGAVHPVWPAALAGALAGAASYAGFRAPADSPLLRRGAEILEGVALGALAPLACWLCGLYGAARGLGLS